MTTTIAYLAALAALLLLNKVFGGFESTPVGRPLKRWVVARDDRQTAEPAEARRTRRSGNRRFRLSPNGKTRQHRRHELGRRCARRPPIRGGAPRGIRGAPRTHRRRLRTRAATKAPTVSSATCGSRATGIWCACTTAASTAPRRAPDWSVSSRSRQLREFDYGAWHSSWRPDGAHGDTGLLTLDDLIKLVLDCNRPVKLFIETKHPVRYGALVESKVLALLHRYGIASPASADLARAVVMSFSAAAVWRIRRAAPMLPTVLLGETSRLARRQCRDDGRGHRGRAVDRDAARVSGAWSTGPPLTAGRCTAGRSTTTRTCGTAGNSGVAWVATNHPGRTKDWLQNGLTEAGSTNRRTRGFPRRPLARWGRPQRTPVRARRSPPG